MFFYQKNKKIFTYLIYFISTNIIFANDNITVEFKFTKLLGYGKKEEFKSLNVEYILRGAKLLSIDENRPYPFFTEFNQSDIGQTIKLEIKNKKNWVIVSPLHGKLVIPNSYKRIEILMVRKYTDTYFDIFAEYEYSVQVFSIKNNRDKAKELVKNLQKDDKNIYHEGVDIYDEVVPIIPNKGYIYKVKVGRYSTLKEARLRLFKIKKRYSRLQDCFITVRSK